MNATDDGDPNDEGPASEQWEGYPTTATAGHSRLSGEETVNWFTNCRPQPNLGAIPHMERMKGKW